MSYHVISGFAKASGPAVGGGVLAAGTPIDRVSLPIGTHRFVIEGKGVRFLTLQWSTFNTNAGASSQINIYSSTVSKTMYPTLLNDLNPATNKYLYLTPIVFSPVGTTTATPAVNPDSNAVPISNNSNSIFVFEIVVSGAALNGFSLSVSSASG